MLLRAALEPGGELCEDAPTSAQGAAAMREIILDPACQLLTR
jgi:hypothetical protein